jgi:hypothetical protein
MKFEELKERKGQILAELANIDQFRKGSITDQVYDAVLKDGAKVRRGLYPIYSFKDEGKTISRRISKDEEKEVYLNQISAFKRFQELVDELVDIGEQISDLFIQGLDDEKKTRKSKLKK